MLIKLPSYGFHFKIKEHKFIKPSILFDIEKIPQNSFDDVSHTDWSLPKDFKRDYYENNFKHIAENCMTKIMNRMKFRKWYIHNYWFQQYTKKGSHTWHNHPECMFSNIYYLELPDKNYQTQFKDPVKNKIFTVNVKEGDFLSFPGCLLHRSPKLKTKTRKTVIVFNSSFDA